MPKFVRHFFVLGIGLLAPGLVWNGHAQLSKGARILLERGLQIQALSMDDQYLHQSTFSNANYTTMCFINEVDGSNNPTHSSRPSPDDPTLWMGAAPGPQWSRWAVNQTQMPPQLTPFGGVETAYMSQLVSLQLGDEWFLDDGTTRTNLINWFNSVSANFPNTILYHNNYSGQVSDGGLGDFITQAHPDMVSFDLYPWNSVWVTNDVAGAPIGGPPLGFYNELRRYRQWGINTQLPLNFYRQTFHSIENYDQRVYRDPSPSELRLNTFAGLLFNAKSMIDFTYNTSASSLFIKQFNGSGDSSNSVLYTEMVDVNRRARNLGKALVRLTPVYDMHNLNDSSPPPGPASSEPSFLDGITTSILFLQGRYLNNGTTNLDSLPTGFASDPQASSNPNNQYNLIYSWFETLKNDPYLNGWYVTNKGGIENNKLIGDMLIAWFHPIADPYLPASNTNEIYMMVVNGLSDPTGTGADCMQEIKLNFLVGTNPITAVDMLDPETAAVTTTTMPVLTGSGSTLKRQLVLDINGGDAILFKFSDGAPFVGQPMAGKLSASQQDGALTFTLTGPLGAQYGIEYSASLNEGTWNTLTNVQVSAATGKVTFTDPAGSAARFYRAVALP